MFSLDMPEDNKEKATSNTFPDYIAYIYEWSRAVLFISVQAMDKS